MMTTHAGHVIARHFVVDIDAGFAFRALLAFRSQHFLLNIFPDFFEPFLGQLARSRGVGLGAALPTRHVGACSANNGLRRVIVVIFDKRAAPVCMTFSQVLTGLHVLASNPKVKLFHLILIKALRDDLMRQRLPAVSSRTAHVHKAVIRDVDRTIPCHTRLANTVATRVAFDEFKTWARLFAHLAHLALLFLVAVQSVGGGGFQDLEPKRRQYPFRVIEVFTGKAVFVHQQAGPNTFQRPPLG
mmetsp:Transcript_49225/g.73209  ORF Transcript_49225/g.73209 Transcript_49225/m.73209 type:complete len:243 (-) Transcript_49225:2225-2953(-)